MIVKREIKKVDILGWGMAIFGLVLLYKFAVIDHNWWFVAVVLYAFFQYMDRVAFGRIKTIVYFDDSELKTVFKVRVNDEDMDICADSEEELKEFLEFTFPEDDYTIGYNYPIIDVNKYERTR